MNDITQTKWEPEIAEDAIGFCPVCHKMTGFLTHGECISGVCDEHQALWFISTSTPDPDLLNELRDYMPLSAETEVRLRTYIWVDPFFPAPSPPPHPSLTERLARCFWYIRRALGMRLLRVAEWLKTRSEREGLDESFGLCPICHSRAGCIESYGSIFAICLKHRVWWPTTVSRWRPVPEQMFKQEWRKCVKMEALFDTLISVEPFFRPRPSHSPPLPPKLTERVAQGFWRVRRALGRILCRAGDWLSGNTHCDIPF